MLLMIGIGAMTNQQQFKALTKKLGLSSQEVAESLGLSKSYYLKALQPSSPCPTWVKAFLLAYNIQNKTNKIKMLFEKPNPNLNSGGLIKWE